MNTNTMNTTPLSSRIAAGVTAGYVRDLSRRSAPAPGDVRRAASRGHTVAAPRFRRDRDDCGERRRPDRVAA